VLDVVDSFVPEETNDYVTEVKFKRAPTENAVYSEENRSMEDLITH